MFRTTFPWWLPGAALTIFGLAIVVFPELLALMVATAFIFGGVSWLMAGYTAQKIRRDNPKRQVFYYDIWR